MKLFTKIRGINFSNRKKADVIDIPTLFANADAKRKAPDLPAPTLGVQKSNQPPTKKRNITYRRILLL